MRSILLTLLGFFACSQLSSLAVAAEKKDQLVGSWTPTKVDGKEVPKEIMITVSFTADGKATMKINAGGKEETDEATYVLAADKITVTKKLKEGKEDIDILMIKTLTADSMVLINEKTKQEMEFKKK